MANADGAVVRRAVNVPFINESPRPNEETISAICIANLEDRVLKRSWPRVAGCGATFMGHESVFCAANRRHLTGGLRRKSSKAHGELRDWNGGVVA